MKISPWGMIWRRWRWKKSNLIKVVKKKKEKFLFRTCNIILDEGPKKKLTQITFIFDHFVYIVMLNISKYSFYQTKITFINLENIYKRITSFFYWKANNDNWSNEKENKREYGNSMWWTITKIVTCH